MRFGPFDAQESHSLDCTRRFAHFEMKNNKCIKFVRNPKFSDSLTFYFLQYKILLLYCKYFYSMIFSNYLLSVYLTIYLEHISLFTTAHAIYRISLHIRRLNEVQCQERAAKIV